MSSDSDGRDLDTNWLLVSSRAFSSTGAPFHISTHISWVLELPLSTTAMASCCAIFFGFFSTYNRQHRCPDMSLFLGKFVAEARLCNVSLESSRNSWLYTLVPRTALRPRRRCHGSVMCMTLVLGSGGSWSQILLAAVQKSSGRDFQPFLLLLHVIAMGCTDGETVRGASTEEVVAKPSNSLATYVW